MEKRNVRFDFTQCCGGISKFVSLIVFKEEPLGTKIKVLLKDALSGLLLFPLATKMSKALLNDFVVTEWGTDIAPESTLEAVTKRQWVNSQFLNLQIRRRSNDQIAVVKLRETERYCFLLMGETVFDFFATAKGFIKLEQKNTFFKETCLSLVPNKSLRELGMSPDTENILETRAEKTEPIKRKTDLDQMDIEKPSPKTTKKQKVPKHVREEIWDCWIGKALGTAPCYCCRKTEISQLNFECGHVEPESKGGKMTIENLRPVCRGCNSSMGQTDMRDYVKMFYNRELDEPLESLESLDSLEPTT